MGVELGRVGAVCCPVPAVPIGFCKAALGGLSIAARQERDVIKRHARLREISRLIPFKHLAGSVCQNRSAKKSSNAAKQPSGRKHYSSEHRGKNGGSRKKRRRGSETPFARRRKIAAATLQHVNPAAQKTNTLAASRSQSHDERRLAEGEAVCRFAGAVTA